LGTAGARVGAEKAVVEAVARGIKEATNEHIQKVLGFVPYPTIDDVPEWLREAMYAEARAAIAHAEEHLVRVRVVFRRRCRQVVVKVIFQRIG
jgi:hypothetical protein